MWREENFKFFKITINQYNFNDSLPNTRNRSILLIYLKRISPLKSYCIVKHLWSDNCYAIYDNFKITGPNNSVLLGCN